MKVKVLIGDNSNREFHKDIVVEVPARVYLVVEDCMKTCDIDEYDEAWEDFCNIIERCSQHLPLDWFIDEYEVVFE